MAVKYKESIDKKLIALAEVELNSYYFEEVSCKNYDSEKENYKMKNLKSNMFRIETIIDTLEQPYRCILYLRYIRKRSVVDIATRLNYCEKQISRMTKKGIEKYAKNMQNYHEKQSK